MDEAEVRMRELTEMKIKFEQLEGEVRERTGNSRKEEND